MKLKKLVVVLGLGVLAISLLAFPPRGAAPPGYVALAQSQQAAPHCVPIGGTIMTNLAVIDPATTLGTVTGDLKGAVSATVLGVAPGPNPNTTVFTILHHFVTEAGDTITAAPANGTFTPVAPGLVAVVSFPVQITGGTGKFAGATGTMDAMGEVSLPNFPDLAGGKTIFRYTGQVCFAAPSQP
jgi:hypothetical protein